MAYEARAPRTSFPGAGRASPPVGAEFVDREAHLERLSAEFRAVRKDRRARVVIVSGEAGAGKTRLASEFIKRHPDALVLAWTFDRDGTQVALSPLASAIGEIAGIAPGSATPSGRRRDPSARRTRVDGRRRAPCDTWDSRCSSVSTSAGKGAGRGAPGTRSTRRLGPCSKGWHANDRSSSCSTTSIGRIPRSWTPSARSVRTRGPDRS